MFFRRGSSKPAWIISIGIVLSSIIYGPANTLAESNSERKQHLIEQQVQTREQQIKCLKETSALLLTLNDGNTSREEFAGNLEKIADHLRHHGDKDLVDHFNKMVSQSVIDPNILDSVINGTQNVCRRLQGLEQVKAVPYKSLYQTEYIIPARKPPSDSLTRRNHPDRK